MSEVRTRRIFGPPGTGKTTTLARRASATVRERGADSLAIVSFSVAAAQEIASREGVKGVLPPHATGTLHSAAYRAIEHPPVALDPKVIVDWNAQVGPTWRVSGETRGLRGLESRDRAGAGFAESGDALLEQLDLMRASAVPPGRWPSQVRAFAKRWTEWKRAADAVDFSDMIIQAYHRARDGEPMPGRPSVLVVDESQDLTPIEIALTQEWGRHLGDEGRLVYALDDDQTLYDFRGADPRMILDLEGVEDDVLAQSWRVPPAVHAAAEAWIARCSSRFPKDYRPREPNPDRDFTEAHSRGWAARSGLRIDDPALVDQIERDLDDDTLPGGDVMVLASCGYMLLPLVKELRRRGIPFHNPYRPVEGAWNPLGKPGRGMSTVERIWRYCLLDERALGSRARHWLGEDIQAWMPLVDAKRAHLVRGAKVMLDQLPPGTVPWELIASLFREDADGDAALARATEPDVNWLRDVMAKSKAQVAEYPLQVADARGPAALVDRPRVVVGTIHSCKGAEASRVYVSPTLSAAGMTQWRESRIGRDQTIRLFYVALTRAFHGVHVLASGDRNTVPPSDLLPPELEVRR